MKRIWRCPEGWVFVILLTSYAYFWQGRDWNSASRLMLTYSLVDRGSLSIDGLDDQTHDIARYRGHHYSDKTPGFSILATVPYAMARTISPLPKHPLNQKGFAHWPADYWITLGTSGLFSALTGLILSFMASDLGCRPRQSALIGLSYGLATPAFAYATLAYGHQLAGFCLLSSFLLLSKSSSRPKQATIVAGFLASYASVVEIQVGPVSAILGIFLLTRVISRQLPIASIFFFALGALLPASILLGYNWLAFGSPWRMGYFFEQLDQFQKVHSSSNPLGIRQPDWSKLGMLLWGERRGLVRFAPILLLTVPGLVVLVIRRRWSVAIVSSLTMAAVVLVNLSYPEWTGGWSTGPRLLVPMLPFAMLPISALLGERKVWITLPAVSLTIAGAVVILGFVAIGGRVPDGVERPWVDGVWPLLRGDRPLPPWVFGERYARNLTSLAFPGFVKQLPVGMGCIALLPLVLFQVGMIGLMSRVVKDVDSEIDSP